MSKNATLLTRIRQLGVELPEDTEVRRTYAQARSKETGAWSWFLYSPTAPWVLDYGSQYTVTELLTTEIGIYRNPNLHKEILPKDQL